MFKISFNKEIESKDKIQLLIEKPHNPKLQRRFILTSKLNSSLCNEGLGKDILNATSIRKKKTTAKCLATKKKNKLVQTSKLIKHKKAVFPVRGILKNHKKGFSLEHSTVSNSQIANLVNQFVVQKPDRHVRFSDEDEILEHSKLHNVCSLTSSAIPVASGKDYALERGKDLATPEVNGSDEDVSMRTEREIEVRPASEKQSSDTCFLDIPNFLRPHMVGQEQLSDRPVTVNQVGLHSENLQTFKQGFRDASHGPLFDHTPSFISLLKEGYNPGLNAQVGPDISRVSHPSDRLIESQSNPYFSMNENVNGKFSCPSQNTVNFGSHSVQYQPLVHFSPKELMRSICSFPDWNQRAVIGEGRRMDEGFCGLPLNSQGELIQLSSSGKGALNQLTRPTSILTGSSRNSAVHNTLKNSTVDLSKFKDKNCYGGAPAKDQLNTFPDWNCAKEFPNLPVCSTSGISRIQGTGRTDVHCLYSMGENNRSVYRLESDLELMNISHHGQKQYNHVQNQIREGKGPPTMRLMGKEFTVSRSSNDLLSFEDGKVWTDKQIIAEHRPANAAIDSSSLERRFQQDFIVRPDSDKQAFEDIACLSETQINQSLQGRPLLVKPPGSGFPHPHLNCKPDAGYRNLYPATNGNLFPKLHPYLHSAAAASPPFSTQTPLFQDEFVFGYESLKPTSQIPKFASSPRGNTSSNPVELQNMQKLPHATKSAFEFPFLRPDCGEHVQPSWFQNSSKSLPPWLLTATQQKETPLRLSQSYSDVAGRHHPRPMYNPLQHPPQASYPYNPAYFHSTVQNSLGPASFPRPPLMPLCREFIPTSSINKLHGERMKFRERPAPRVISKESDQGKKTRKRPAAKSSGSQKPIKMPNLTVQEDSNSEPSPRANVSALELESIRDKESSVECRQTEIQTHGMRVSPVIDTLNVDEIARSGPIRLSAGAKHIIKPSSNMNDQDNSRPTHSTIPFDASPSSVRVSESEKRTAQIYRF
ncbi:hypothetical protein Acr_00g0058450 [Actinidia rufa]|uniref:Uncharacterized protein n=1 Tax=Actinidia rufa TaxID=165716 RepID=A0A7J0DPT9_9ERIC|nr:hypothetical protein Acr_00g0058450 [Actinidia rufa]